MKHLLTESASLQKIIGALVKGNRRQSGWLEVAHLIMADPTAVENDRGKFVGKYWKWIYSQFRKGNIHEGDIPELQAALETYNINKSRINKPITEYGTLDELVREIAKYDDTFKASRTLSKGEQELEKVYEDQYVVVYIPHTWRAARKIGGDTRWCTASSNDYRFNYYLNNYGGEYYDIIRKSDGAKFQLHPESRQFMNAGDHCVNFSSVFDSGREAEGLIGFLENRGKDIGRWEPKVWFDEVEDLLNQGVELQDVFDSVYRDGRDGIARVVLNGKCNFIDKNNRLISPNLWFDRAGFFNGSFSANVEKCKKANFLTKDGKILSPDLWFDDTYPFSDGTAKVYLDGKWNCVDEDGKLISPDLWFDKVWDFEDGFAAIKIGEKWNYMNKNGELLSPGLWFDRAFNFVYGKAKVVVKNRNYYITTDGEILGFETKQPVDPRILKESKQRTVVITETQARYAKRNVS